MNFKLFATVFVGLLAVNLSVQSPSVKADTVKTILVEVVDGILDVKGFILSMANDFVDQIESNQTGVKNFILELFDKIGKDVNTILLRVIDELRAGATADGNAVIDCIDAQKDNAEAAVGKVFNDLGACVFDEVPKALNESRIVLGQVTDLLNDLQGQTDALEACTDAELACVTAWRASLVETVKKISPIVVSDVKDIIALVKTILADIGVCNDDLVTNLGAAAQDVFNDAVVCIKS